MRGTPHTPAHANGPLVGSGRLTAIAALLLSSSDGPAAGGGGPAARVPAGTPRGRAEGAGRRGDGALARGLAR